MANNILEMALEQLDFPSFHHFPLWFDDVTVVSLLGIIGWCCTSGAL